MRPPSDLGLPALGLVCQALLHTSVAFGTLAVVGQMAQIGSGGHRLLAALTLIAGFVRAAFHARVAERLRERSPEIGAAVRRYAWVAVGCTAVMVLGAHSVLNAPPLLLLGLVLIGLSWPLTLWLLTSRKAVRAAFATSDSFELELVPADRSIEGLGVLMVSFAVLGLAMLLTQIPAALDILDSVAPVLVLALALNVLGLLARGIFHLVVGLRAMGNLPPELLDKRASTYQTLGFTTAGLLLLGLFALARGNLSPGLFGVALVGGYFLVAWPLVVRRFASRLLTDPDGQPLPHRDHGPASDRGLSAFGYLLIGVSVPLLSTQVAATLIVVDQLGSPGPFGLIDLGLDGALSIASGLVGIWAGLELIAVSPRRVLATLLYAALSAASLIQSLVLTDGTELLSPGQLAFVIAPGGAFPVVGVALLLRRAPPAMEATPPRGTPARTD
ncbi:MAG TPA: hypothetical protein PK095_21265 [Myxococcota bacterium]|nr:hypothetical protein [Myxococcota bacterium]